MATIADNEDPVVRSSRREALWIFLIWCVTLIYCVTYCAAYGYGRSAEELTFVLGFPSWVFWGVIVPWGVCTVLSAAFTWFVISDDPLGAEIEYPDEPERDHA
ncbi:MAG: DUF997 family protein [Planctomycetia bacterium]|nr:DUF997 family protein [Planctomycetia bacterium]